MTMEEQKRAHIEFLRGKNLDVIELAASANPSWPCSPLRAEFRPSERPPSLPPVVL